VGETGNEPFQLAFNCALKVDFQGSRVTSDGGLVLVRELDERLGFGEVRKIRSNRVAYAVGGESRYSRLIQCSLSL
jgi:hypothetical protein